MAPFKLKFRMGSSRSTSQEHDPDPQVNEALLNHHHSTAIGASSSTIDSADCNSLGSLGTNERRSLLPAKVTQSLRLGYIHHGASQSVNEAEAGVSAVPTTPPPSYEHVLEENTRLANNLDLAQLRQLSVEESSHRSATNLEQISFTVTECTDPDCRENFTSTEPQQDASNEVEQTTTQLECNESDEDIDNRKESIDSTELLIASAGMTAPSSQDNLLNDCTSDCRQYNEKYGAGACGGSGNIAKQDHCSGTHGFCDPLMNHSGYCSHEAHCIERHSPSQGSAIYMDRCGQGDSDVDWEGAQMVASQQQQPQERALTPEFISNKSSKELYKDLAKKWGITCKMSDGCRCMECQGHYFDCEFDDNEHQKTDGGLGAGTPMFISEVMHGTACTIL